MLFKKINAWLHLWLGLASGTVVFILGLTGCILVFKEELKGLLYPWTYVEPKTEQQLLPPSRLHQAVSAAFPAKEVHSVWYHGLNRSAHLDINSDSLVHVDPYTGHVLGITKNKDFFRFIDEGHRTLWLGRPVGSQIVGWSTFIFVLLLLSGLILWFPPKWNKTNFNKSFKIKWKARFKRLNYDLHNVLGFYALLIALLMGLSGMMMSFRWFSKSIHWLAGGKEIQRQKPQEIQPFPQNAVLYQVDKAWNKVRHQVATANKNDMIISFPDEPEEAIYACTDMVNGAWRDLYIDPNNLALLPQSKIKKADMDLAGWIRASNYGIHVGSIGGMATKILYFFGSLICASLPLTGFYIWWGKRKKTSKKLKSGEKA